MSEYHASRLEEPNRRTVWIFGPEDEQEVASLLSAGWLLVHRRRFAGRQRIELVERRKAPVVEALPKPPREGMRTRR